MAFPYINGPVPIGFVFILLNTNSSSLTFDQMCLGNIPTVVIVINGEYGCLSEN